MFEQRGFVLMMRLINMQLEAKRQSGVKNETTWEQLRAFRLVGMVTKAEDQTGEERRHVKQDMVVGATHGSLSQTADLL